MIRIAITAEAFEAIARTLPFGSMNFENKTDELGRRLIWLDPTVVNRLRAMRGPDRELQRRDPAAGGRHNASEAGEAMTAVHPFDSPKLTLKRAKHHIRDLKEVIRTFTDEHPWTYLIDAESQAPNFVHKYRFHKLPPADMACILFDAVNNLRAALDQIGYSAATASGKIKPRGGLVTLRDQDRDEVPSGKFSSRRDCLAPRGHRCGAEHAVRLS